MCRSTDWYEAGRLDGAMGKPPTALQTERAECLRKASEEDLKKYEVGRYAGLLEYCAPASGFELGRNGTAYKYVCPAHFEKAFLQNYDRGLRLTQLERQNLQLNTQIQELRDTLEQGQRTSHSLTQTLTQQLESLALQKKRNDAEMAQVQNEASRQL